jgi:hypothetical protein
MILRIYGCGAFHRVRSLNLTVIAH